MILHSVKVANWRRLTDVSLGPFSPGITVIASPNRTGKSSLVEAIRCGLLEWHYDSTQVQKVVPWRTEAVPAVCVEFEAGGSRYRLEKRFSRRKGGGAELCRLNGGEPQLLVNGKEVTPRIQQLLGVGSATSGVAQLLWVDQGLVAEPEIDQSVGDQLRRHLGTVITGQDQRFHELLTKRLGAWYTERSLGKGEHKRTSLLKAAQADVESWRGKVGQVEAEFAAIDELLAAVETLQHQVAETEALLRQTDEPLKAAEAEAKRVEAKRREFEARHTALERLQAELQRLESAATSYQQHLDAARQAEGQLVNRAGQLTALERAAADVLAAYQQAVGVRRQLEGEQRQVIAELARCRAMQRLWEISRDLQTVTTTLARAAELASAIEEAAQKLAAHHAPSSAEMTEIQSAIQRLGEVEAELRAGELTVHIEVKQPVPVTFTADSAEGEQLDAAAGAISRQVRQRARIELGDVATVEVARGTERVDLDALAAEGEELIGDVRRRLATWGLAEADRGEVVPRLMALVAERNQLATALEGMRREMNQLAPGGTAALQARAASLDDEREQVLVRQPKLHGWTPSEAAAKQATQTAEEWQAELSDRVHEAADEEKTAEAARDAAQQTLAKAQQEAQELQKAVTEHRAKAEALAQQHGSAEALLRAAQEAREQEATARTGLEQYRLTEDEEQAAERLTTAQQARDGLERRYADLGRQLTDVQGQLKGKGSQGSHLRRYEAEQALQSAEREAERIALEAEAHRVLAELFATARDESVGRAIEPVSHRLEKWLPMAYGGEHVEVEFASDLGVQGVAIPDVGSFAKVAEATSYGEREQLGVLIRLAYGAALASEERQLVILDDPLAHSDGPHHRRMLDILAEAAEESLQILILTCHPDRFEGLKGAGVVELRGAPGI